MKCVTEMGDLDEEDVPVNSSLHKFSTTVEKKKNNNEKSNPTTPTNDIEAMNGTCSTHGSRDRSMKKYCIHFWYFIIFVPSVLDHPQPQIYPWIPVRD